MKLPDRLVVKHLSTVTSTMDVALELLPSIKDFNKTYVVLADEQVQGRGSRARYWHSPKGGFYATFIMPFDLPVTAVREGSIMAGVALAQTLQTVLAGTSSDILCKWPNDVLVNGHKIAGILLEYHEHEGQAFLHIGFGVNLITSPGLPDNFYEAINILFLTKRPIENTEFMEALAPRLLDLEQSWRGGGFEAIRQTWLDNTVPEGTPVSFHENGTLVNGFFAGIDAQGALRLKDESGSIRTVNTGDLFFQSAP